MSEQPETKQPTRQRYKSTKGDADKRKITSKANFKKARETKLAQLKEQKQPKT